MISFAEFKTKRRSVEPNTGTVDTPLSFADFKAKKSKETKTEIPTKIDINFSIPSLKTQTSTPAIAKPETFAPQSLLFEAGKGMARQYAATGQNIVSNIGQRFYQLEPNDLVDPDTFFGTSETASKIGRKVFGKDAPFSATTEDVELLETFGVDPDVAKGTGGSLTVMLTATDLFGGGVKGIAGATKAIKNVNKADDAIKLAKNFGFADDIATQYADVFVKAKTTKEAKEALEAAIKLQNTTKLAPNAAQSTLDFAAFKAQKAESQAIDPLLSEARKYKNAEEFINNFKYRDSKLKVEGRTLYHGTNKVTPNIESSEFRTSNSDRGTPGFSVTFDKKRANDYGEKVFEVGINPNAKIITLEDALKKGGIGVNPYDLRFSEENAIKWAFENGYDGIDISKAKSDWFKGESEIRLFNKDAVLTKSQLTDIWKKANPAPSIPTYKGETDLTTKLLTKLEGRSTVSKQFISDITNSPDLKQAERDLIRNILKDEGNNVTVTEFANKVKSELLPLERDESFKRFGESGRYENFTLDDELRGPVANYSEHIYSSPIKTSAGNVHFSGGANINGVKGTPENYFAHSRIEDLPGPGIKEDYFPGKNSKEVRELYDKNPGSTRRVIEIQSDLFQKGRLEGEKTNVSINPKLSQADTVKAREAELSKLEPYRNTWHERVIREEVKQAAVDGKTKLQFPTGETAMKIEGLGDRNTWELVTSNGNTIPLRQSYLEVGNVVSNNSGAQPWIITDVLGDGKFKAVPKQVSTSAMGMEAEGAKGVSGMVDFDKFSKSQQKQIAENLSETFDISGKVDTNNPIYKFYEKEVGKYLKNKYGAQLVTDAQGVKWWEVAIKPEYKKAPVEAFGGVAGIERDESGNLKFDPLKGALGVAGMTGAKKIPTIKELKELGKRVDNLAGKSKEVIKQEIGELGEKLSLYSERIEDMPGKRLQKFISKKEGQFVDLKDPNKAKTMAERLAIEERNKKILAESETAFEGTAKSDMYDDPDTIREAIEEYQSTKQTVEALQEKVTNLRKEHAMLTKAEVAAGVGVRQRKNQLNAIKDRWTLTDNETKKFLRGRNISAMSSDEWSTFVKEANKFGEQTEIHRDAMMQLKATIENKELKKWENLQAAMNLPPIHQMNTEQVKNFEKILEQYKTGDEFLPSRMMQTIDNTELKGLKTTREVLEVLAKKSGKRLEDMPIKPTEFHKMLGDRRLGKQHPFFEVLVERKNRSLIEAESRVIELTDEVDELIKKARSSRPQSLAQKAIPTDQSIVRWLEADEAGKTALAKDMTEAELKAAKRMDEVFKSYYEYLVKRHAEQKFSRFEGQYFPHVRRGFLEAWKDDGLIQAFKEMKAKYDQDAFTMNILNEQTQEILPYEKWVGFSQFRSGNLIPTSNASKAFNSYVTALEKAKHLDEMVPEVMAYVHSLSPRNLSQHGIELDTSLKKFVKEYINANKGRVPKGFFNPGGQFDVVTRGMMALTRMLDLGFNFTTQIAAPIGENLMTLTMLKPQAYKTAYARSFTKQGKNIINKYKEFTGRTPWETMTKASSDLGDKLMSGAFAIYGKASQQANSLFLLGKLTDEEFATGVISSQRLAQLKLEMSKYRSIKGLESILGRTTEVEAVKQYKSWAIPIFSATAENATELAKLVRTDGVKALASEAGKELFYSVGVGSAIGLMTWGKYQELKDKGGERSFLEDIAFKAMRDATSIYGAFDPTLWSGVRLADFIEDIASASLNLVKMEEYKTTGELKGLSEFEKALTPSVLKRFTKDEEEPQTKESSKLKQLRGKTGGGTTLKDLRKGKAKSKLQELRR